MKLQEAIRLLEACKSSILDESELEQNAEKQKDRLIGIFTSAFQRREGWNKLEYIEEKAMRWGFSREDIEDVIRHHVEVEQTITKCFQIILNFRDSSIILAF